MTNPQIHSEEALPLVSAVATGITEGETLAYLGFTEDEITSLLWLRQWYQHGGSDRIEIVRSLEIVQQQVLEGQIER
ncbi:MAG: hypothetical protein ABI234_14690 [Ktedonobacteraceae bacterium]